MGTNFVPTLIFTMMSIIFVPVAIITNNIVAYGAAIMLVSITALLFYDSIRRIKLLKDLKKNGKQITITPIRAEMDERTNYSTNGRISYSKYLVCSYIDEYGFETELKTDLTFKNLQNWLDEHPNTQLYAYMDINDASKYVIPFDQIDLTPYDDSNIF